MAVTHSLLATIEDFLWFLIALVQPEDSDSAHDLGELCCTAVNLYSLALAV